MLLGEPLVWLAMCKAPHPSPLPEGEGSNMQGAASGKEKGSRSGSLLRGYENWLFGGKSTDS
ncbi:hypothetical protein KAM374_20280 [Aeromonas caviae]|nr:hypothetical protein KAM374_20280 [Aeromonas caviae]